MLLAAVETCYSDALNGCPSEPSIGFDSARLALSGPTFVIIIEDCANK
jgi:hypothetical protein